jgi:2-oxoglutarate dehydrogenase E2 component (dihydrolipoamide succinyltransferase)
MGESITEATILTWKKQVGDKVEAEEVVLEVATDKVDSDVPSPVSGILKEIKYQVGEVVQVGEVLAVIEVSEGQVPIQSEPRQPIAEEEIIPEPIEEEKLIKVDSAPVEMPKIEASTEEEVVEIKNSPDLPQPLKEIIEPADEIKEGRYYSPLVMNIAKVENISTKELDSIAGTGLSGRVTKEDVLGYLKNRKSAPKSIQETVKKIKVIAPESVKQMGDEVIEMDRMRKIIAKNMVESVRISPHVTSIIEADMTNIVNWRNKHKKIYEEKYGVKLTFMPFIVQAIAKAILDYPMINISVDGENIIKKGRINIGVATALPNGNLIVPVLKDADRKNLMGIAKDLDELVEKARTGNLKPDDIDGGTYTVSNIGSFGNVIGTPIIVQPQVAILAVGAIEKKPSVIETADGDMIAIRHKMFLSHTYDHRVVDGMLGGLFVKKVAEYLSGFMGE